MCVVGMMWGSAGTSRGFATGVLLMLCLSGCTGVLDTTVAPRASLEAYPVLIQEGEIVTLDARESSAIEGIITNYLWDFGDGTTAETIVGFTSHSYPNHGQYTIRLTVTNDQGGSDDAIATIMVNGAPSINITMPSTVRSGDAALLDASNTYDPEGGELDFSWDLDGSFDNDGDGDSLNDADATTSEVLLETERSGIIKGQLTVNDGEGATAIKGFELNVTTRNFKVVWVTETLDVSWDEYLDQGETWQSNLTPGDAGRVLTVNAILELDQDIAPPHDNFTLSLNIVEDNYRKVVDTEPGNYSTNEPARAEIFLDEMNAPGEDGMFVADSAEELLQRLLSETGNLRGGGEWIWSVFAQQSEPDSFIGEPDPDPGNDWTLTLQITIMRPSLTEVSVGDGI
ncbi:MAG: PKD domain-containing protein [Candidatus Poseidonia sp.]|nr:PKD domain-containing protein [Poseidonia sp.]